MLQRNMAWSALERVCRKGIITPLPRRGAGRRRGAVKPLSQRHGLAAQRRPIPLLPARIRAEPRIAPRRLECASARALTLFVPARGAVIPEVARLAAPIDEPAATPFRASAAHMVPPRMTTVAPLGIDAIHPAKDQRAAYLAADRLAFGGAQHGGMVRTRT